jgi:hypothetical protein
VALSLSSWFVLLVLPVHFYVPFLAILSLSRLFSSDLTQFNGLIVCGGDGMVSEVVTGLMTRQTRVSDFPIGIVPVGE